MQRIKPHVLLFLAFSVSTFAAFAAESKPHDFARWEKDMAAFEQMDKTNPPPKNAIVFTGSSTVRFWTSLPTDFPNVKTINRGFGGSMIVDAAHFADQLVIKYKPRAVFLRAGSNDIIGGRSVDQVFEDFQQFDKAVHAKLPETDIYYISLAPSVSRWKQWDKEKKLNELVRDYISKHPHLKYVDATAISVGADGKPRPELFRKDMLHFNADGYKLLVNAVRPYVTAE